MLVPVFCWVTGAFAAFEYFAPNVRLTSHGSWSVESLPMIGVQAAIARRQNAWAEIVFGTLAVLWWQAVPAAPYLMLGPAAKFMSLGPIWTTLHWPILLVTVAGVVQAWINLFHPELTAARASWRLVTHAAAFTIGCLLLRAGSWIVATNGTPEAIGEHRKPGTAGLHSGSVWRSELRLSPGNACNMSGAVWCGPAHPPCSVFSSCSPS